MYDVIVADDRELYLLGVVEFLSADPKFQIVAKFTDLEMLLGGLLPHPHALVIASTSLVRDTKELVKAAQQAHCQVLLVTEDADCTLPARPRGVAAILPRSVSLAELARQIIAIRRSAKPPIPFSRFPGDPAFDPDLIRSLSPAEFEMIELLLDGLKHGRIAERLDLPVAAVRRRFQRIFDKTGQSTRLELALFFALHRAHTGPKALAAPRSQK